MSQKIKISIYLLLVCTVLLLSCGAAKKARRAAQKAIAAARADSVKNVTGIREKFAAMMEIPPASIKNIPIYRFLDKWIYFPYAKETGSKAINDIDFIKTLYKEVFNKNLPGKDFDELRKSELISFFKDSISLSPGDLIFFEELDKKKMITVAEDEFRKYVRKEIKMQVLAMYLQDGFFVCSSEKIGAVSIIKFSDQYWGSRWKYLGRLK